MLDWLIIGGGIHGTHLSNVLIHQCGVPRDRLVVLDPFDEPMARWRHCTDNTGMTHLRSPVVHHVGLEPMDLLHFSKTGPGRGLPGFRPPYDRPSLQLFEAHCSHICDHGDLRSLRRKGYASHLARHGSTGFQVDTDQGLLKAHRVVLATGTGQALSWPGWAKSLRDNGANIWHLFDMDFTVDVLRDAQDVIVVGLGISAAQLATRLASKHKSPIQVVGRHELRVHQFDSEPCWLGPRCQAPFRKINDFEKRRQTIEEARHRSSIPPATARRFQQRVQWGQIAVTSGSVESSQLRSEHCIELQMSDGTHITGDALVLATGFDPPRPDQSWLADAIEELDLACANCGFPIVDEALQWTSGLHVSGPLAELELGPAAPNIAGARMTSRRLAALATN